MPEWAARSLSLGPFSEPEAVVNAERCSPCAPVATAGSGIAVRRAANRPDASNGAQRIVGINGRVRANGFTGVASEPIGGAKCDADLA